MGLMVALAFVVVGASSLIDSASAARPPGAGVSPPPGDSKSNCAKAEHLPGDQANCPDVVPPSRP
jgi:hypothetical protein